MVRQSTSANKPLANPKPSVPFQQEPIAQELHVISGHLWWLSLSAKLGLIMMAIGIIAMLGI